MHLTIEKIMVLKSLDIFSETPEEDLVEIASVLKEVEVKSDEKIIEKGELGTSMYIIVQGQVLVHDGDIDLAILGEREVFGEMAALDPEPRSADVTAVMDTDLLELSGSHLHNLIVERGQVAWGILKVLCRRLRKTLREKQNEPAL